MLLNPAIIVAIIAQSAIAKYSKLAGAVVGFLITTGILIWGLMVYSEGDMIAIFGIPLSQQVFILACAAWYVFDAKEFMAAKKELALNKKALESPLLHDHHIVKFYQTTQAAWAEGKLSNLNKAFEQEGKIPYENFVKAYPPREGSSLYVFFTLFPPKEGEYLVGIGDSDSSKLPGWFVLTNLRLIQRDGRDNSFKEIALSGIESYEMKGSWTKTLKFFMKSGECVDFEKVDIYPAGKFLDEMKGKAS